ncbi:MAG TPA: hypothetical protein VFR90_06800 [Methylibium sp.]|uniref:hypothetical protein n=1 Tax=Methylibium sp. TaxID=2067992 RepID=UPI002DB8DFCB|nr:hypothetical protein [Methylibium sp.]HEU4458814.1 hypothetical protein [Methylibium sp.]
MPTTEQIQPLNYCAHAIEDLLEFARGVQPMAPKSAHVHDRLVDMLCNSVKFLLPNCCDLIDPDDMKQAHLDLVRLPFPCVAFEAPWDKGDDGVLDLGDFPQTPATKRIALCWEARPEYELLPGLNDILEAFPEGGIFVMPIYWGPEYKRWTAALGGSFVPYDNEVRSMTLEQSLPASRIANAAAIEAGLAKPHGKQFRAEPFYLLPEFYEQMLAGFGGNLEKVFAQIMLDSRDETMMLVQACSVINCANVGTATIEPAAALNKKRLASGKQPFFTYKVLQLTGEGKAAEHSGAGGTHAGPRMHLRRGHLRRLQSKVIWVRPTMVGASSEAGFVVKDYAIGAAATSRRA